MPGRSAPRSTARDRDLRQRAGAAGEEGRGAVPAVDALEVIARAEGRAEGRERKQPDGEGIGADLLEQMARDHRAQRNAEQHQHGLGQERRQRELAPGDRGDPDRDHRAGDQPAGKAGERNARPPAVPMTSVSAVLRILARLGRSNGREAAICFTPPYRKSARGAQLRARRCRNARASRRCARRIADGLTSCRRPARRGAALPACASLDAFAAEFLALLALQSLGVRLLGAFERLRRALLRRLLVGGSGDWHRSWRPARRSARRRCRWRAGGEGDGGEARGEGHGAALFLRGIAKVANRRLALLNAT